MRQWEKERHFRQKKQGRTDMSQDTGEHVWAAQGARGSSCTVSQWYNVKKTLRWYWCCSTDGTGNFSFLDFLLCNLHVLLWPCLGLSPRVSILSLCHCHCSTPGPSLHDPSALLMSLAYESCFLLRLATHSRTATNHTPRPQPVQVSCSLGTLLIAGDPNHNLLCISPLSLPPPSQLPPLFTVPLHSPDYCPTSCESLSCSGLWHTCLGPKVSQLHSRIKSNSLPLLWALLDWVQCGKVCSNVLCKDCAENQPTNQMKCTHGHLSPGYLCTVRWMNLVVSLLTMCLAIATSGAGTHKDWVIPSSGLHRAHMAMEETGIGKSTRKHK